MRARARAALPTSPFSDYSSPLPPSPPPPTSFFRRRDDESCGQCVYAPNNGDLSVPWDCLYINVECGGGADCLNKPCGRPGGENHKGAVDFWRRKKQSYSAVASLYGA